MDEVRTEDQTTTKFAKIYFNHSFSDFTLMVGPIVMDFKLSTTHKNAVLVIIMFATQVCQTFWVEHTGLSKRNGAKLRDILCLAAASHSRPRQAGA